MPISKFLDPTNDTAFRRIFGTEKNKDILISFINHILGLKGASKVRDVTFQPTIQIPEIASKKESVIDVLCKADDGVQFIVEMQVAPQQGFLKRAQYYAAKAYSRQLKRGKKKGARYQDLKAVIFIAICDSTFFKDKEAYLSRHVLLDQETYSQDLEDFSFTFIELPKFTITDIDKLSNIVEKWCYFFKHAATTSEADLRKIVGKDHAIERAYEELNQFNWSEEELIAYEEAEKRSMDSQATEDYFFDQGETKGRVAGRVEGRAEGRVEGRAEGIQQRNLEIAKSMLKEGVELDLISKVTGLDKDSLSALKEQ
jgi:predicted transposase/invertase (TIGR01784 family)